MNLSGASSSASTCFSVCVILRGQFWSIQFTDYIKKSFYTLHAAIGAFEEKFAQVSRDVIFSGPVSWDISTNFSPNTLYMLCMRAYKLKNLLEHNKASYHFRLILYILILDVSYQYQDQRSYTSGSLSDVGSLDCLNNHMTSNNLKLWLFLAISIS